MRRAAAMRALRFNTPRTIAIPRHTREMPQTASTASNRCVTRRDAAPSAVENAVFEWPQADMQALGSPDQRINVGSVRMAGSDLLVNAFADVADLHDQRITVGPGTHRRGHDRAAAE